MITCTDGIITISVTEGAYEGYFRSQGFKDISKKQIIDVVASEIVENTIEEMEVNEGYSELIEKPISQWTKAEVKQFAIDNDIDISGTRNVGQAKEIIKDFLSK